MRALVVFYSLTGHTRTVAREIARQAGCDMAEVSDERPRSSGWGKLRAIVEVLFGLKPRIVYQGPNPENFDVVIVGSPIWAAHIASPMGRFLSEHRIDLHRVACFFCYGGQGADAAIAQIARIVGAPPHATLKIKDADIESGHFRDSVHGFVESLAGQTSESKHGR